MVPETTGDQKLEGRHSIAEEHRVAEIDTSGRNLQLERAKV
jgi:hypothetical protein